MWSSLSHSDAQFEPSLVILTMSAFLNPLGWYHNWLIRHAIGFHKQVSVRANSTGVPGLPMWTGSSAEIAISECVCVRSAWMNGLFKAL